MTKLNSVVLRNKGVPVDVYALTTSEDGVPMRAVTDEEGAPRLEKRWVRMDANCIADIEERYGSLEEFETVTAEKPFKAIRSALAVAWGVDDRMAGLMMVDGRLNDYSTAVGVAVAVANGVDPTNAADLLEIGVKAAAEELVEVNGRMRERIKEAKQADVEAKRQEKVKKSEATDSRGKTGSESGVSQGETSTTSGDTVQLRSAS